jgi:predicted RNase H-like HicB family nuclease
MLHVGEAGGNVDKSVDYYMGLRYTVELKPGGGGYEASIREIPECIASVPIADSVEKLWQLLEKNQREWIEREIEMGREVPEPPGATRNTRTSSSSPSSRERYSRFH